MTSVCHLPLGLRHQLGGLEELCDKPLVLCVLAQFPATSHLWKKVQTECMLQCELGTLVWGGEVLQALTEVTGSWYLEHHAAAFLLVHLEILSLRGLSALLNYLLIRLSIRPSVLPSIQHTLGACAEQNE